MDAGLGSNTATVSSLAEADAENVRSFGSFGDWLASFSPTQESATGAGHISRHSKGAANSSGESDTVRCHFSRTSRILITVKSLTGSSSSNEPSLPVQETIEVGVTDFLYNATRLLHQKGTQPRSI